MSAPGKGRNCWIFLGPELGEKQAAIDALEGQLAEAGGGEKIEKTVWYAGETPVPVMAAALRNGALFAEKRLFLIKNAEAIKKKNEVDLLTGCLESPLEGATVVLISEETSVAKGLMDAAPPGNKKIFYELFEEKKTAWVGNFFRSRGFRLGKDAIDTILELVENNTQALERECSRLTLFLDRGTEISAAEAEKWLSHSREESAFTLFSRIAAGDFPRSLESLRALLAAKEAPPTILAGLAWCFRKLRDYLALTEAGVRDEFEFRKIGVAAPQARKDYAAASRRYDSEAADRCLALTAEADILLRSASSTYPAVLLMDRYLYRIHLLGRRP